MEKLEIQTNGKITKENGGKQPKFVDTRQKTVVVFVNPCRSGFSINTNFCGERSKRV